MASIHLLHMLLYLFSNNCARLLTLNTQKFSLFLACNVLQQSFIALLSASHLHLSAMIPVWMVQLLFVSLWVPCSFLSQTTNIYSVRTGELECLFVCLLVCDELECVQASLDSHPGAAGKDFWREKAVEDGWMDRNIDVEICCNYTWYLFFNLILLNSKQTPKFRENRMCCIGQAKIQLWLSCNGDFFS